MYKKYGYSAYRNDKELLIMFKSIMKSKEYHSITLCYRHDFGNSPSYERDEYFNEHQNKYSNFKRIKWNSLTPLDIE